jgi:hypothetical protein
VLRHVSSTCGWKEKASGERALDVAAVAARATTVSGVDSTAG